MTRVLVSPSVHAVWTVITLFAVFPAQAQFIDCDSNGIDDACDIDCGDPGGPCDVPGCGGASDCNGNGIPDACDTTKFNWLPGSPIPNINGEAFTALSWDPDGAGPEAARLVVGGEFDVAGRFFANRIAQYDGTDWRPLGAGVDSTVLALAVLDNDLIAGGWFLSADGTTVNYIARWDGSAWQPLGVGMNGPVRALAIYNGDLIAGGDFTTAGGVSASKIARWDGSAWHPLGLGIGGPGPSVRALTTFGADLIVGGAFSSAGGQPAGQVAVWDGTAWSPLTTGTPVQPPLTVYSLAVFEGQVHAAGLYSATGGGLIDGVARWDGADWTVLGTGTGMDGIVETLAVFDNSLYAGGNFTHADGVITTSGTAIWDGIEWQTAGIGKQPPTHTLAVHDGALVAGAQGVFRKAGTVWNGANNVGAFSDDFNHYVNALTVYNGELIVGGSFTKIGNDDRRGIARWDGTTWKSLGDGLAVGNVFSMIEFEGDLVVGGDFGSAIGTPGTANVARWDGTAWQSIGGGLTGPRVNGLAVYNGELIAGGKSLSVFEDGIFVSRDLAAWDGISWRPFPSPSQTPNGIIQHVASFNGQLWIAGLRLFINGSLVTFAHWDGTAWHTVDGSNPSGNAYFISSMLVMGNNLFVTGTFSELEDVALTRIARWDGTDWHPLGAGLILTDAHGTGTGSFPVSTQLGVYHGQLATTGLPSGLPIERERSPALWDGTSWTSLESGVEALAFAITEYNGQLVIGGGFEFGGPTGIAHSLLIGTQSLDCDANLAPDECQSDTDTDGVIDPCDNCVAVANGAQADVDGDLVGDACDNCIAIANANQKDCDLNLIGDVCEVDLEVFVDVLLGQDADPAHICIHDMNASGTTDAADIQSLIDQLIQS